jgi:hypothetical protein
MQPVPATIILRRRLGESKARKVKSSKVRQVDLETPFQQARTACLASALDYPASRHCELLLAGMRRKPTATCMKL